jgi:hypothetical protein
VNGLTAHFQNERGKAAEPLRLKINSGKTPKGIRVEIEGGAAGIYSVKDETVTINLYWPRSWRLVLKRMQTDTAGRRGLPLQRRVVPENSIRP